MVVNLNDVNLKIYEKKINIFVKMILLYGDFEKLMSDLGNSYFFKDLSINKEYFVKIEDGYDSGMNYVLVEG